MIKRLFKRRFLLYDLGDTMKATTNFKTWIEIKESATANNIAQFRELLSPKTKLFAVVKSNAYGHGLLAFSGIADKNGVDGFCVDSVIEGQKLRQDGIKKLILVLGPTFRNLLKPAFENNITITVSNFEGLDEIIKSPGKPNFHLKIDTGMRRQGFYLSELPKAIKLIADYNLPITGCYTHFAAAKDINYPTFTENQFAEFQKAMSLLEKSGFKNLIRHAAATGGTLINKKYHLDAVRIGIGLYGPYPSPELAFQIGKLKLEPILSWHTLVSEVKKLKAGDYVGYDMTEKIIKPSKSAILPIGYWHGYPRALSGIGEVLIGGKRARVLGRVSMDMLIVDVSKINCRRGDEAVIIGRQKNEQMEAYEVARKCGASYYELLTRINPLIERVVTK